MGKECGCGSMVSVVKCCLSKTQIKDFSFYHYFETLRVGAKLKAGERFLLIAPRIRKIKGKKLFSKYDQHSYIHWMFCLHTESFQLIFPFKILSKFKPPKSNSWKTSSFVKSFHCFQFFFCHTLSCFIISP